MRHFRAVGCGQDPADATGNSLPNAVDAGEFGRGSCRHRLNRAEAIEKTRCAFGTNPGQSLQQKQLPRPPAFRPVTGAGQSAMNECPSLPAEVNEQSCRFCGILSAQDRQAEKYADADQRSLKRVTLDTDGAQIGADAFQHQHPAMRTAGDGRSLLEPVSYTHLRAHETVLDLVCRLLL